jgi:hypothetical protein
MLDIFKWPRTPERKGPEEETPFIPEKGSLAANLQNWAIEKLRTARSEEEFYQIRRSVVYPKLQEAKRKLKKQMDSATSNQAEDITKVILSLGKIEFEFTAPPMILEDADDPEDTPNTPDTSVPTTEEPTNVPKSMQGLLEDLPEVVPAANMGIIDHEAGEANKDDEAIPADDLEDEPTEEIPGRDNPHARKSA